MAGKSNLVTGKSKEEISLIVGFAAQCLNKQLSHDLLGFSWQCFTWAHCWLWSQPLQALPQWRPPRTPARKCCGSTSNRQSREPLFGHSSRWDAWAQWSAKYQEELFLGKNTSPVHQDLILHNTNNLFQASLDPLAKLQALLRQAIFGKDHFCRARPHSHQQLETWDYISFFNFL